MAPITLAAKWRMRAGIACSDAWGTACSGWMQLVEQHIEVAVAQVRAVLSKAP